MKRALCLPLCLFVSVMICAPAIADTECWYEYQYGTHDYEQVDVRKATCTEDGYYLLECRQCGKNVREITGHATGHSWQKVNSQSFPPTCTGSGITTYVCNNCSQTRTESVTALGHDMRDETVVRSPTCETEGRMSIRCVRCGFTDLRDIPRADYQYGEWHITTPATDHSAGTRQSACAVCEKIRSEKFFPEGTLMRGSKGEAVRDLQQMLMDLHILEDKADGIFGAKTEDAVLAYQRQAGFGEDGIAWPQTLAQLTLDWQASMGLAPAESSAPGAMDSETSALHTVCGIYPNTNDAEYIQYCDYHREIADMAASLLASAGETNMLRARKQVRTLWLTELDGLYGEWLQGVPTEEQGAIIAAQATFMNYLTVHETALQQQCDSESAALQINAVLENQCAILCNMLRGER